MSPGYKDLLYLQTLTTELEDVYPVENTACSKTYNLLLKRLGSFLVGQKRAANATVLWHISFLETERRAAVTALRGSVL